jgi:tryptophan-rich sensory protein
MPHPPILVAIAARAGIRDMSYIRFGLMILTSTLVMFILMYLNTYAWEHVFYSETRTYMAIMMGATMAVIMLA